MGLEYYVSELWLPMDLLFISQMIKIYGTPLEWYYQVKPEELRENVSQWHSATTCPKWAEPCTNPDLCGETLSIKANAIVLLTEPLNCMMSKYWNYINNCLKPGSNWLKIASKRLTWKIFLNAKYYNNIVQQSTLSFRYLFTFSSTLMSSTVDMVCGESSRWNKTVESWAGHIWNRPGTINKEVLRAVRVLAGFATLDGSLWWLRSSRLQT